MRSHFCSQGDGLRDSSGICLGEGATGATGGLGPLSVFNGEGKSWGGDFKGSIGAMGTGGSGGVIGFMATCPWAIEKTSKVMNKPAITLVVNRNIQLKRYPSLV